MRALQTSHRFSRTQMIPVNRPVISEQDVLNVTNSLAATLISGETTVVRSMEAKLAALLGVQEAIAVSNGTDALDLCIEALDIKNNDHCVLPTFTIISTVANLARKKAKLELVDADPLTWSMNAAECVNVMVDETRLVLPVHIYGLPVDMDVITEKSKQVGAFVLEDAAEALGVKYLDRNCGSIGDAATFSFFANKIVTGGEGGAIVTDDIKFAERIRYLRNLCFNPNERFVHTELGWNSRISGLSAALISSQLDRMSSLINRKRQIAELYLNGLENHPWFSTQPTSVSYSENLFWVFGILLNPEVPMEAKEFQELLKTHEIETRRFFCPIHLQPIFGEMFSSKKGAYPISENLWRRGLYLPSGLGNTDSEIEYVIEKMWEFVR